MLNVRSDRGRPIRISPKSISGITRNVKCSSTGHEPANDPTAGVPVVNGAPTSKTRNAGAKTELCAR